MLLQEMKVTESLKAKTKQLPRNKRDIHLNYVNGRLFLLLLQ